MRGVVISQCLRGGFLMHEGDPVGNLLLEVKVGGLVIPSIDGGRDSINSLDAVHDPRQDPSFEI